MRIVWPVVGPALLAFTLVASLTTAQQLPILFDAPWIGFSTGTPGAGFAPNSMATGDLDGDGDVDAFVGQWHFGSPGVTVLLNLGNGTFAPPMTYNLPSQWSVGEVGLVDIDGDGDLDGLGTIPDINGFTNIVALWRNNGDGTLAARESFPTGVGPVGLAIADFNKDGFPDVATADYGFIGQGTTASVLLHNGQTGAAAGLTAPITLVVGDSPFDIAAQDLDGNATPELVIARGDRTEGWLVVLMNRGGGTFGPPTEYPSGGNTFPIVALADIDRDGDTDALTSYRPPAAGDSTIQLRRNDGTGILGPAEDFDVGPNTPLARDFEIADLDGDGWPDVLAATPDGRQSDGWRVLWSDGAGGLGAPQHHQSAQEPHAIAAADIDGDGDLDVLTVARFSAELSVHRNFGGGAFTQHLGYPIQPFQRGMEAADIDGDGDEDVAFSTGRTIQILRNNGDGTFAPPEDHSPAPSWVDFRLRDLNGDGFPDLLVGGSEFTTALNNGDGTFAPSVTWSFGFCADDIDAYDFDNDGDLDVVMTDCGGFPVEIFLASNDGTGSFTPEASLAGFSRMTRLHAADLNNDSFLDIVTIEDGYGLGVFLGNGDMTFQPEQISTAPAYRFSLVDLNGDGFTDAALAMPITAFSTDSVGVALGNGDGTFLDPVLYTASSSMDLRITTEIDAGDVDCDGIIDLVTTNTASNDFSVFISNGDGTLQPHVRYGGGNRPMHAVLRDFTGDGVIDIASDGHPVSTTCCNEALTVLPGLCGCDPNEPPPGVVGNVLLGVRSGDDVVLQWPAAVGSRWRVFRDGAKTALGRSSLSSDTTRRSFTDIQAVPASVMDYYQLKQVTCAGRTGP